MMRPDRAARSSNAASANRHPWFDTDSQHRRRIGLHESPEMPLWFGCDREGARTQGTARSTVPDRTSQADPPSHDSRFGNFHLDPGYTKDPEKGSISYLFAPEAV